MRNNSLMQALKIARQVMGNKDRGEPPAPPRLAVEMARKTMPEAALLRAKGGRLLQDKFPSKYMPGVGRQVMAAGGEPDPAIAPETEVVQTPETPPAAPPKAYVDPPTQYLTDWNWRGLPDVQASLGGLKEIPSHVKAFGSFMNDTANRAGTSGLTPRDLIKAYTITRASIQRRAVDHQRLRDSGLILPNDVTGYVRPEGAFGHWLHTNMGKKYLSGAVKGVVNPDAVANAVQVMAPFGKHEKDIPDALIWAAKNLPGREQEISRLVAQAQQGQSEPSEWRAFTKDVRGIGPSKSGFVASLMGRGDQPTLDARQVILHTGRPTKEAQKYIARSGGKGGEEAVDRLAARQRALNLGGTEGLEPYYQHLTHHAVWDKASNEETTHEDVVNAMRHAADGGAINGEQDLSSHPVAQGLAAAGAPGIPQTQPQAGAQPKELNPVQYQSWDDVPTINPQDLVGKRVFPIFADLTKAGSAFSGIDSSKLDQPEQLYGGPGYPLLPESQQHGLAWAVEGKGRGTSKLLKDADYIAVSAMEPFSHQSNASFSNALMKNMAAYVRDQRLAPEGLSQINQMIQTPSAQKELQGMEAFPGFEHPDAESFLRNMTFEQRKRVSQVLSSKEAQDLGAPNIEKITQSTLDPQFSGVPSRHAMFLMEIPKTKAGRIDDEELNKLLVHLKTEGLPEHPSYQYGIRGNLVGKFHYPVAPEVLFKDWFDQKNAEAAKQEALGKTTNVRRAFDLAMPVSTITQDVADRLPHHPRDIQSGKAAQLGLNAFNDQWSMTGTPISKGGLSPTAISTALKNSEFSSTLSQYTPQALQDMIKDGKFTGYKLKGGEVYFGLKRGTDYADEYGFQHPELGPNETSLVSVVNNEPGARGVGGAPVVLKAIQHGATALDCFAVPSAKHPNGFLPTFYSNFGFEELGRVPFDPQYVSPRQLEDMKHEWTKSGWDESMGMPALSIMKWKGNQNDRESAVRSHILKGSEGAGIGRDTSDVEAANRVLEHGAGPGAGASQGERGLGDTSGDRGGIRNGSPPRPADRFTRTLAEIKKLSPDEMRHFGVSPEDVELAKSRGLKSGGAVGYAGGGYVTRQDGPFYRVSQADDRGSGSDPEGARREVREAPAIERGGSGPAEYGSAELSPSEGSSGVTGARSPLDLAQQHVRDVHGRDFEKPNMPESSLAKQSAIGRVYSEAVNGSPEYKNAIFSAYAQQMPEVIEQSGAQNYDDLLRKAYEQMAKETDDQFRLLKGYNLSFHRNGEGNYPTSKHMVDDVNDNKHLFVFQGGDKHDFLHNEDPDTGLNENEKFRAVHDLFGHAILGNQFGAKGEETAWGVHQQMYSPLARLAMTPETRGQNSFANYTPINAELKEKLNDLDERIVADRRAYRDTSMLEDRKKKMFEGFQFAPNKAVLLPPEFLSTEYNGGMPSYMKDVIRPAEGTGMSSKLTHFSNEPGLTETDPSRYGTGIKGDEASRLRSVPGAVKDRSYFYLGEPEAVTPEEGLGQHRYEATAENLYNLAEDPLKFKTLAREANRQPWSSNFNPGTVDPNRFSNDLERLAKEHGYSGVANPNAAFPMAAMFEPTPVTPRADGGGINADDIPSIDNPISVFPKPQRMYSDEDRVPGGQYLDAKTKADLTGKKAAMASIGINPSGKPYFNASPDDVDETGSPGKGSAITKANLFKQKAGWKWVNAPDGHEDTSTVVSVAHRGDHHYALNAHFPKGVDFARYENASSEPRLRPTTRGNIIKGDQVGSISVRGKEHPVYDHIIVKAAGGAVDNKYNGLANHGNSKSIVDKALMLTSRKA